jgi:hypothetical protein
VVADGDQPCEELVVLAVRGGGKSVGGKEGIGAHAEVRRVDVGVPIALGASSQQLGVLALAERAERAGVVEIGHSSDGVRSVIGVAEMIEYPGATHGGVGIGALRDPLVTAQPTGAEQPRREVNHRAPRCAQPKRARWRRCGASTTNRMAGPLLTSPSFRDKLIFCLFPLVSTDIDLLWVYDLRVWGPAV